MSGDEKVKYKEIFIRNKKETGHYHLGLISLEYKDKTRAKIFFNAAEANKAKYFSHTKILTKHDAIIDYNTVVALYSETFIDQKIKNYFNEITK